MPPLIGLVSLLSSRNCTNPFLLFGNIGFDANTATAKTGVKEEDGAQRARSPQCILMGSAPVTTTAFIPIATPNLGPALVLSTGSCISNLGRSVIISPYYRGGDESHKSSRDVSRDCNQRQLRGHHCGLHFTDEETEVWAGQATHLRSPRRQMAEQGFALAPI